MKKFFLSLLVPVVFWGCSQEPLVQQGDTAKPEKIQVVTTLFPLYDFAKSIGGESASVSFLLPPGVEPHGFEPKPSDIVAINNADVFVYTGEYMEAWAHDIIKSVDENVIVVDASRGVELMEVEEEHGHEGAFEWAGLFDLKKGEYQWSFAKVNGDYADPAMKMVVLRSEDIEGAEQNAERLFDGTTNSLSANGVIFPNEKAYQLVFDDSLDTTVFTVNIEEDGKYVFFTEHMPTEFESDDHFLKDIALIDVEPIITEPEADEHHHDYNHNHGGFDPHIWLDFERAQVMAENIAEAFAKADPKNADVYQNNLRLLKEELAQLDEEFSSTLSDCQKNTIILGGHNAFGYLLKHYGISYQAAQGMSPNSEPSAKDMVELAEKVQNEGVDYIFYEELLSPKVADTIAQETGAKTLLLHGAHNVSRQDQESGVRFVDYMRENLKNLSQALECE